MLANRPRSPRVIYVAGTAREFPPEVRDWLSQGQHRAVAAPNVYDALARLTGRHRPAAMIVSIESVDWEEMEFFDLARQLSRPPKLYVAGPEHQEAKLAAAVAKGARRFDENAIDEDLAGHSDAEVDERPNKPTLEVRADTPRSGSGRFSLVQGLSEAMTSPPEDRPATKAEPYPQTPPPAATEEDEETQDSDVEQPPTETPGVRLVAKTEVASLNLSDEPADGDDQPIPFPWAPSQHRPQRTPPPATRREPPAAETARTASPASDVQMTGVPDRRLAASTVELTAEELAALMGKPGRSHTPPRPEGTS